MKSLNMKSALLLMSFAAMTFLMTSCSEDEIDISIFLGTYTTVETCQGSGVDNYTITISAGTDDGAVLLDNLYGWDEVANATVNGDQITIPTQTLDGLTFSGSGTLSGNILTIDFTVSDGTASDTCQAVATK